MVIDMNAQGTAHCFGSNIDTDVIIPARYLNMNEPSELAAHCMEDIDSGFAGRISAGDIIVGGTNFGCGSSREHAPIAIKACGISCVIAASFARIFYRNAINTGLCILECAEASEKIQSGDSLAVDFDSGEIRNITRDEIYKAQPFPEFIQKIISAGGLLASIKADMPEIRHGTEGDIDTAAHNVCEAWRVIYAGIIPDEDMKKLAIDEKKAENIRALWQKGLRFLVASSGGVDCGMCSYMKATGKYGGSDSEDCAYIVQLYVHPDYQHRGIGTALMDRAFEELKTLGYKNVTLDTLEKNTNARSFYERKGFTQFGSSDSPVFSERVVCVLYKKEL